MNFLQFARRKARNPTEFLAAPYRRDFVIRAAAPLGRLHSREDPIARQKHRIV